jgi:ribosomal protein S18 acetylase RimI-like enzyme
MSGQDRGIRGAGRRGAGLRVVVRELRPDELVLVEELLPSQDREVHARRLASQMAGSATYFIAWLGDRPVGHTLVRWGGSGNPLLATAASPPPIHPYIEGLAVHHAYRSRSIGTQIIRSVEQESIRRGFREIGLAVGVENVRASALYRQLGYRDRGFGEFPNIWSYRDDAGQRHVEVESCVYLVKTLSADPPSLVDETTPA